MKKHLLWMMALLLIACLLPAAQAMAEPSVPDFASFSDGRFALVNETDYGFCALKTYEAPRTESEEEALEALMLAYKEWFMDNSDMTMGGEHFAEQGRFGAYEQEASWFSFNESGDLSSFSMNLIDTQVESCHVMLAFKAYDDKYGLDMYISSGVELTEYVDESIIIPDFAAYAGSMILKTEEINGITSYTLPRDIASDLLFAYSSLLETDYGFSTYGKGAANGMNYVWLEQHETVRPISYAGYGLDGEGCFLFAYADAEGDFRAFLYPDKRFVMEDTGERYASNVMVPVPAAEEDHQEKLTIPSLEAFMNEAVKDTRQIDGVTYYRIAPENVLLFAQYGDMLSSYGIYGAEETDDEDGFPFYAWFEDCEQDLEPEEAVLHGRSVSYYLLATINVEDGDFLISVDYADCLNPVDTGERWDGVSIPSDELLDAGWYVSAALASAPGQEPQEKVTVPMLEAFMNEAVKETQEIDGVTHYRVAPENASALIQYFALMEDYGVYQLDESEEEYGLPMYLWLEDCDHDAEPKRGSLHGYSTDYYVLVAIDVDGSDFLISVDYADCLDPVDTGDRWDGVSLTPDEIPDEWPFNVALASEPVLPELSAAPGRVLVSEPADVSQFAHTYSPDAAFMQDMVTYCAGRLSYEEIDDSANYMVRNYKGSKSDYQLVKDYVDMLVETNPYLELQHVYEETYDDTFYSFAIDYTGNVNLGPQTEQTFTDNMCDIMLYGTIERDRLELSIWTPANMELVDLGMRWGGEQADVSIGGGSALAGLYRNADGTFETTDGRFWVAPGEAMVLRDGFAYTTEATFDRDDDGNRDRIWMRYFYRDETLHLSYPTRSLMAGDVFRLSDFNQESSWLVRDRGILDGENSLTGYRWDGLFLGVNHDGDWMTPVNAPTSSFSDATVRVMYMDKEVAVFYIYAEYTTSPLVMEALCAVPLTDELTEDEIDYTTYVGQSINVSYEWTEFGASYELFDWEIISGGDLASLSNTESKTCTLTANKPGLVGLRVSYNYGAKEPDVLTGNPRSVSRTKTQDYTIMIK